MTDLAGKILQEIQDGKIDPVSAIEIVKRVAKVVRGDKEAAVEIIDILVTKDELPPETARALKALLDTALVSQLAYELSTKKWCCF